MSGAGIGFLQPSVGGLDRCPVEQDDETCVAAMKPVYLAAKDLVPAMVWQVDYWPAACAGIFCAPWLKMGTAGPWQLLAANFSLPAQAWILCILPEIACCFPAVCCRAQPPALQ